MRRLMELLRFELRYQVLRPASFATIAATTLLLSGLALVTVSTGFGPPANAVNGAFVVTETIGLMSLLAVFTLPMLCIQAALRDDESSMRELIDVTPTSALLRWLLRFIGVLFVASLALVLSVAVLAIAPFAVTLPAERVLPFRAAAYLHATTILALPNLLWSAALLFAVSVATRSRLAAFVTAIALYAGYMVTALMVDSPLMAGTRTATPELMARVALLDPFGLSAFFEQTRTWTPPQQDTTLVALSGRVLWNRLGVTVSSLLVATLAVTMATRRQLTGGRNVSATTLRRDAEPSVSATAPRYARVTPQTGYQQWWTSFRTVWSLEASQHVGSWALRALVVMWVLMIAIEADGQLKAGEYGTRVLATTAQLADAVPQALQWLGALVTMYFATEVFARERLVRFDGIRDATPTPSSAIFAGKLVALMIIPVIMTIAGYGVTVAMHLWVGGLPFEPWVLAAHMLVSVIPLLILTALTASLQILVGQRWIAMFLSLVVMLLALAGDSLGLSHPLTRFGAAPALLPWSTLDGYGTTFGSWLAFQSLWALGAIVLCVLAAGLFERGELSGFMARVRHAPQRVRSGLSRTGRLALVATALSFGAASAALAWQTTRVHRFPNQEALAERRVGYEKRYRRLAGVPQPSLVDVALDVELYPRSQRADIRETLTLANRTGVAIDTVWLSLPRSAQGDAEWQLLSDANALRVAPDTALDMLALIPSAAIGANDTLRVALRVRLDRGGVRAVPSAIDVARDGSMLSSAMFLPEIGYSARRELSDSAERVTRGLPLAIPQLALQADMDSVRRRVAAHGASPAWFTTNVRITTDADQVALAPGALDGKGANADGSRVTYRYHTSRPGTPFFSLVSGRYESHRTTVGAVPVEVWFTPSHRDPARRLLTVTADALALLESRFGPYPHDVLRVIEVQTGNRFGAYAEAASIYLTESRGMLSDARDGDVDLLGRRIGHEVAHEWWGHVVSPLNVEGRLLLVESVAKYAEQLMAARHGGDSAVTDMLSFDHDRYMRGRSLEEPPLVRVDGEPTWYYAKGALAFRAAHVTLGDSTLGKVLRDVLASRAGERGTATASEFVDQLRAAAPDSLRSYIDDWFSRIVMHELVMDSATATSVAGGTRVRGWLHAQRVDMSRGQESATPADAISVRVTLNRKGALPLWLWARVKGGRAMIDTVVAEPRASFTELIVDPEMRYLDRDRQNNRIQLQPARE